jgi:hypothetical protein
MRAGSGFQPGQGGIMFRKKIGNFAILTVGFIAGIFWIAACGGGTSAVSNALATLAKDIGYDNTSSHLTASDVQTAIDEIVGAAKKIAFDDTTANLSVDNVQDAIEKLAAGNYGAVTATGTVTAADFAFKSAQTGYVNVPGVAFVPTSNVDTNNSYDYASSNGGRKGNAIAALTFTAPVYLPDGATITELQVYTTDPGAGKITVTLYRYANDASAFDALAATDSDLNVAGKDVDSSVVNGTVDNMNYSYLLQASIPKDTFILKTARITFTYTTPTF